MSKKIFLMVGALLMIVGLMASVTPGSGSRVYAVDIFSQCSNSTVQQDCADCSSGLKITDVCTDTNSQASANTNPIINDLKIAINILSIAIGAASVIIIIISGLRMTISSDSQSVSRARDGVIYSLVGILIATLSQAIVIFVLDKLT
jgi:hypothetical protein